MTIAATKLTEEQIQQNLQRAPHWSEVGGVIQRTWQFKDFVHSLRFVEDVAALAEKRQHHPDILIRYNKVTLSLSTHDAGGITSKDFDLAAEIDPLARE